MFAFAVVLPTFKRVSARRCQMATKGQISKVIDTLRMYAKALHSAPLQDLA